MIGRKFKTGVIKLLLSVSTARDDLAGSQVWKTAAMAADCLAGFAAALLWKMWVCGYVFHQQCTAIACEMDGGMPYEKHTHTHTGSQSVSGTDKQTDGLAVLGGHGELAGRMDGWRRRRRL